MKIIKITTKNNIKHNYINLFRTEDLPEPIRQEAYNTFSDDWIINVEGELRWFLTELDVDIVI